MSVIKISLATERSNNVANKNIDVGRISCLKDTNCCLLLTATWRWMNAGIHIWFNTIIVSGFSQQIFCIYLQ